MASDDIGILSFDEGYFERIWGGRKLETLYGKPIPEGKPIGEAWLISDHAQFESCVQDGPFAGKSLRSLMEKHGGAILGSKARPTVHGRFPLLLKILDASDYLSVQVHPNDEDARRLNEPDVGKTEMWHVLHAEKEAELICGLHESVEKDAFETAIRRGGLSELLTHIPAPAETSVFVPAGTVHAIGAGIVLAEIQQNSDITYRVYDWGRVQADGKPRELHVDKALEVTRFGSKHRGAAKPLQCAGNDETRRVHAACRYFAAEEISIGGRFERSTHGDSFHIVLATKGATTVKTNNSESSLAVGEACLIPANAGSFTLEGDSVCFDYYVPDLDRDIVKPLLEAGHERETITMLGGDPSESDLAAERLGE